jgi:hypothetical protein
MVRNGKINTWDYQYGFLNLVNKMVAIVPNNNMISNIGFNESGTHTVVANAMANIPFKPLTYPLKHPGTIAVSKEADEYTLKKEVPPAYNVFMDAIKLFIKELLFGAK